MLSLLAALALPAQLPDIAADTPGCAIGVVENGRLTQARGYGLADLDARRPIGPDTPFNIASMSKQFTGAAIALLIAEGRLSPEDDVRRYLPELRDYGRVIRVRHLLNHSSGLRNHMALAAFSPDGPLPSHEQALAAIFRQSALNFAPGARHQYDSPNYVLLAEIVARVSGRPFERFLAERFFVPLGMASTGFDAPGLARAYAAGPGRTFALNEKVNRARGSSGIVTTVADFARWLAYYDRNAPLFARMTAGSALDDGTAISYGYGLSVEHDHGAPGRTMVGHGGQTAAYRSSFAWFPAERFGAVMLCNRSDAPLGQLDALVGARFPVAKPAPPQHAVPLPPDAAARYAGFYRDPVTDALRRFAVDKGALQLVYAGQPYPLVHLGGGRFAFEDFAQYRFAPDGMLTETGPDQPAIAFARLADGPPSPLSDFVGEYRSPDLDGSFAITVAGDALLVESAAGEAKLAQIHPDGFAAPEADFQHLAFTRDADGRVTGFTLTTMSGINHMRFDRI